MRPIPIQDTLQAAADTTTGRGGLFVETRAGGLLDSVEQEPKGRTHDGPVTLVHDVRGQIGRTSPGLAPEQRPRALVVL